MTAESVFDRYRADVTAPMRRLFSTYGEPRYRWFVIGVLANLIAQFASLLPPVVLGAAINVLTNEGAYRLPLVPAGVLPSGDLALFELSVLLIGGSFLLTGFFTWVYGIAANEFAHGVMHAVRVDCFEKLAALDMAFFDDKQTGEVMSILSSDTENLELFLDNALTNSVRLGAMLLGIGIVLFAENAYLAVVTLLVAPLMVAFTRWFMHRAEPLYAERRSSVGKLNTRLENAISGMELTKSTASESYEVGRVETASKRLFDDTMAMLKLSYFYRPGMELLAGVSFTLTFVVGGYWLFVGPPPLATGELGAGTFVTFLFLSQRFATPLAEVSNIVDQYENALASAERVFGLMDVPVGVADSEDAVAVESLSGQVEYDDVSFAYGDGPVGLAATSVAGAADDDATADGGTDAREATATDSGQVIDGVSFAAEPGETIALVGPTGAGKSTLAKLLLRLYDVTGGAVRVDGHDVRDLTLRSLRSQIGYVGQDTFLFDGTIAENIEYGDFEADDGAVREAAKAAEAHEFIQNLPDGYDTRVGERGVKLSGGQRQRIAIARVVLRDPPILVLDEATSAVDTETEYLIQRSLDALSEDRTTVAIAHRLSTVKDADRILVVEDGVVTERGSHSALLERDGLYADLWRVQAGDLASLPEGFRTRVGDDD
ncbi:ABC transporter ATP-binding protein [Salinirubrum litoreum]|uniref:ABC transporter ATP-binding protein n=1 Tax=Salinirubrum litoreum TaxID=1126234 RepID=A0ABD5RCT1_9EURY|nr:ABC transporter ATP-binding protein [Salinirubrum litoreum]